MYINSFNIINFVRVVNPFGYFQPEVLNWFTVTAYVVGVNALATLPLAFMPSWILIKGTTVLLPS